MHHPLMTEHAWMAYTLFLLLLLLLFLLLLMMMMMNLECI